VRWLWTIFLALDYVAWPAEQLRLECFFDKLRPCPRHVRPDGERLGLRVDVIELKIVGRTTSNALAAEQLDQAFAPMFPSGLDVPARM
jgi:hypothetical protein